MTIRGKVQDGVIVPDQSLPEGVQVQIEVVPNVDSPTPIKKPRRQGGMWKGKIWIADDFDVLPDDIADAFGMSPQ